MAAQTTHQSESHGTHANHTHKHGPQCGHTAVRHEGHVDYLHDGHLHHVAGDTVHEHTIPESASNRTTCTPEHTCDGHDKGHRHSASCGHPAVPHGNHMDYLVDGHLHHPHGGHCDEHGTLSMA